MSGAIHSGKVKKRYRFRAMMRVEVHGTVEVEAFNHLEAQEEAKAYVQGTLAPFGDSVTYETPPPGRRFVRVGGGGKVKENSDG